MLLLQLLYSLFFVIFKIIILLILVPLNTYLFAVYKIFLDFIWLVFWCTKNIILCFLRYVFVVSNFYNFSFLLLTLLCRIPPVLNTEVSNNSLRDLDLSSIFIVISIFLSIMCYYYIWTSNYAQWESKRRLILESMFKDAPIIIKPDKVDSTTKALMVIEQPKDIPSWQKWTLIIAPEGIVLLHMSIPGALPVKTSLPAEHYSMSFFEFLFLVFFYCGVPFFMFFSSSLFADSFGFYWFLIFSQFH